MCKADILKLWLMNRIKTWKYKLKFMVWEKNHHVSDALIIQRKNYQPLHTGGSFVLGQEQDAKAVFGDSKWDPGFEPGQSLSGSLAQVELWSCGHWSCLLFHHPNKQSRSHLDFVIKQLLF